MAWPPRTYGGRKITKELLFGQLVKKRPCHGTKKRWRDGVKLDLQGMILHRINPSGENLVMKVLKVSVGRQIIVQPIEVTEIIIIPVRVEGLFEEKKTSRGTAIAVTVLMRQCSPPLCHLFRVCAQRHCYHRLCDGQVQIQIVTFGPPLHITFVSVSISSINITWLPPHPLNTNRVITTYRVLFTRTEIKDTTEYILQPEKASFF